MGSTSSNKGRPGRARRSKNRVASPDPVIEIDSKAGAIRIRDARLVNPSRRAFCERLLEAATRRPGISKAEIDIDSASCRIEFVRGSTTVHKIADAFADCVREAVTATSNDTRIPDRLSADWLTLTAYPLTGDVSLWEIQKAEPGRIRLNHPRPQGDRHRLSQLAEEISRFDDVVRCRALSDSQSLAIDFRDQNRDLNGFLDEAERSFESLLAQEKKRTSPQKHWEGSGTEVASGPKRVMYLVLAGGAFTMTLVGLVVPGIPTVPFLLGTSYFLARSSRRLNEWLSESILFGSIVSEWKEHGALSESSKVKLLALTAVIVSVAIVFGPLSLVGIVFLLVVSCVSVYGIVRLPSLPDERRAGLSSDRPARLALPAP